METTTTTTIPSEIDGQLAKSYRTYWSAKEQYLFLESREERFGSDLSEQKERQAGIISAAEKEIDELEAIYNVKSWSRFYLVVGGHIHAHKDCSTCHRTTQFQWLTALSGMTESDAVAEYGSILCSVCFPSAPVEMTNGESKEKMEARAEREAKKAARIAKKQAAALIPEDVDGGIMIQDGPSVEWVKTISAAKSWLTDRMFWNSVRPENAERHAGNVQIIAEALAARTGKTAAEEIAAAEKRAAKHLK